MRIKIVQAGALLNEETGERAGLFEEHDVQKNRAEYLISVGAAEPVDPEDAQGVQRFFGAAQGPMETPTTAGAAPEVVDVPGKKPAARKSTASKASK